MRLTELYIENFGKLSKYKMSFSKGLNSIIEDNGYGKTTLTVFIKAMLYGYDANKKHSLDDNERKKYTPWQGGAYGGWLSFEVEGKNYRIERTFAQKASDDTFMLLDLDTGKTSNDFKDPIGESIFGIDRDGFEQTVFLSEKNLSIKIPNDTVSAKLSDLVGTEGDIGGFDSAIKLLEDRRRFYQKKGGSGEIADTRRDISYIEDEIVELKKKREIASMLDSNRDSINEKIKELRSEREKYKELLHKEQLEREKRSLELQYRNMLNSLTVDEKREDELLHFFEKKIPTNSEIAEISEAINEKKRLSREISDMTVTPELSALSEFFSCGASQKECENALSESAKLTADKNILVSEERMKPPASPFVEHPDAGEIARLSEKCTHSGKKKSNPISIVLMIIGVAISVFGVLLAKSVSETMYLISILGVLLIFVGILTTFKFQNTKISSKSASEVNAYIKRIYGDRYFENHSDAFKAMQREAEEYKTKLSVYEREKIRIENLEADVLRREREIRIFTERFPKTNALTLDEAVTEIYRRMQRYSLLLEYEGERSFKLREKTDLLEKLTSKINAFITNFPVSSDDPIQEIRTFLAEYEVLRASLSRRRSEAERFALSHGIQGIPTNNNSLVNLDTGNGISSKISELDEAIIEAESERTKIGAEYDAALRDAERIDELDELLADKREAALRFEENLAVINIAKELLGVAKENMTAKYIGPTKNAFLNYIKAFNEECGDYMMDTEFAISKLDSGKSRPEEAYSRGTRDLHSLAARFAMIDSLFGSETPPIILDDPFASFDDDRKDRAIAVIRSLAASRQIIYMTPSKARRIK